MPDVSSVAMERIWKPGDGGCDTCSRQWKVLSLRPTTVYFPDMYRIHLESCSKIYGRATIFTDLDASFSGHTLGIGGRNGSGKTTLLKMMSGLIRPTSGTVRWMRALNHFNGTEAAQSGSSGTGAKAAPNGSETPNAANNDDAVWISSDELPGMIGMAAPWMNGYAELSCLENLEFTADLRSWRTDEAKSSRRDLLRSHLEALGLGESIDKPCRELSSGQQQRLRLALATFFTPEILLLDEPTTNLDERGSEMVLSLIRQRQMDGRLTVLASNVADELHWCQDVIWLERTV